MKIKSLLLGILIVSLFFTNFPIGTSYNKSVKFNEEFSDLEFTYSDSIKIISIVNKEDRKMKSIPNINQYTNNSLNPIGDPIDSPWPMHCHDNHHTGLSPYNTSNNPGTEKWRFKTLGSVDCGIAIDNEGILYFGDFYGDVYALYPNGTVKWIYDAGNIIFTSTPCIGEDGTIYVGSYGYKLHAVNPDGTPKWVVSVGGNVDSSPAIGEDGTIYVGHHNYDMVAVNPNGTIKWKFPTGFNVVSDPAIADDGTIIFGSGDEYIYALYPNGTLRWKYKTGWDVKGSASIDDDGIIYMACWDGYLYAFYVNGTLKSKTTMGIPGTETNPSFGPDGTIYVSYDGLVAINPDDGSVKWKFNFLEDDEISYLSSPAVSADGIIYIGTEIDEVHGGHIYAINPDGTLRWRKMIADVNTASSPSIAEDGTVYIGSWWSGAGSLHAFNEYNGPNHPPEKPMVNIITRPSVTNPAIVMDIKTVDPDMHPTKFIIDWGDNSPDEETLEIASDMWYNVHHLYPPRPFKTFELRIKAVDNFGAESNWTTLKISLPYQYNYPGWQLFQQWLEMFPQSFPIIRHLLGL